MQKEVQAHLEEMDKLAEASEALGWGIKNGISGRKMECLQGEFLEAIDRAGASATSLDRRRHPDFQKRFKNYCLEQDALLRRLDRAPERKRGALEYRLRDVTERLIPNTRMHIDVLGLDRGL